MATEQEELDSGHRRPDGLDDLTVEALGSVSKSLETIERVRGHLYALHQLTGTADFELDRAVELLRKAGRTEWAEKIETDLIGRNLIAGRWTYQIVEEFDDGYYSVFRELEKALRDDLAEGKRHLHEAEMKLQRRTPGQPGHKLLP